VLRQPLEDGTVTIARAATSLNFPARFMLVAAMNPCPCGFLGDRIRSCTCSSLQVQRYRSRLSGPLLDRIDMHIEVPAVQVKELIGQPSGETSAAIRERVNRARVRQRQRFSGSAKLYCNAQMSAKEVKKFCRLDPASADLLNQSITRLGLSARAYHRILKIALTIADLAGFDLPNITHVAEAIQYRRIQYEL
jgi:magnesium chelatase family protein